MNAKDLVTNIDPCTGQGRASVPLLFQVGRGGLDLLLSIAYDSGTLGVATRWNQDAPTGIVGLGWGIARDRIFARYEQSLVAGDVTYYLQMNGVISPLNCIVAPSNGLSSWATTQYMFWNITYNSAQELWTVIDEDGIIHTFGDSTAGRGTVDLGVAWGGWIGPNTDVANQRTVAVGWSVNSVSDLFGNTLTYFYDQVQAQVASAVDGLYYTQASYLSSITGGDGAKIVLQYALKSADEYQDPHTSPAPPNPWQSRFETQYLTGAVLNASSGQTLASVTLEYASTPLGSGTLSKRLLTSMTRLSSSNAMVEPPTLFSYWGQDSSDNVSATSVQSGAALYGALKQVTSPLGATLSYAYQSTALSYANRSLSIAPSSGTSGWASPVIYSSTDAYVLVTWLEGTTVHVQSYIWIGRWIQYDVMTVSLGSASYSSLKVATHNSCCALQSGAVVTVAAPDSARSGAWFVAAPFTLTPTPGASDTVSLVAGDHFVGVLDEIAGNLFTYRFTGTGIDVAAINTATGWVADSVTSLTSQGSTFALSSKDSMLATMAVSASGTATLALKQLMPWGSWRNAQQAFTNSGLTAERLNLDMGCGFAVAWSTNTVFGGFQSAYASYWWNGDGTVITGQSSWPQMTSSSVTAVNVPIISGATVVIGQQIYRFTGTAWHAFSSNSITYPEITGVPVLSVGSDLVARLFTTTSGSMIADILAYDPTSESWAVPTGMSISGASPLAAVAPNTLYGVANYAVVGAAVWFRNAAGSWVSILTLPSTLSVADMSTIQLLSENYLTFQQGTGTNAVSTSAYLLENGTIVNISPVISLANEQIALPAGSAGSLVGRGEFTTFTGTFGESASQLKLYRPVFGNATGEQTGYTVASVTSDNGYSGEAGINGSVSIAFAYQAGAIDGAGTVPFFNTVTAVPGQSSTVTPASGTMVMAYYVGLTASETPGTPYPACTPGNASSYTRAISGTLYQSTATATNSGNTQTTLSQQILSHQVTLLPLGSSGVGVYGRLVQQVDTLDGVSSTQTLTYNSRIGFVASSATQVTNAAGTLDSFSEQFSYFYSIYDTTLSLNLLSPVIQTISSSQPAGVADAQVIGIELSTWRNWSSTGQNHWAPERRYQALNMNAAFTAWTYGQSPSTTNFVLDTQILSVSSQGLVLETVNEASTPSSASYDQSLTYMVWAAQNCAPQQALWFGCEPYESSGTWSSTVSGKSITDLLTTADFHTGTRSLTLALNTPTTGPQLQVQPTDQTRLYQFSCWAKTDPSFLTASGIAIFTLTMFNPATFAPVGSPITLTLTPTSTTEPNAVGQWAFFQATIDLPSLVTANGGNPLGIVIVGTNANTLLPCYVDELRFMPIDCGFAAFVYDPTSFVTTALINGAGQCKQTFFDDRDMPYLTVGPDANVESMDITTYARWISSTGDFQTQFPNVTLSLGSAVNSVHYDFHNPDTSDWRFSNASWVITGGELTYGGSTSATASCLLLMAVNQAAQVFVTKPSTPSASVALGNGIYAMRWTNSAADDGSGTWTLEKTVSGTTTILWTNITQAFNGRWLLVMIDGMIAAYAGSVQLFGYMDQSSQTTAGTITLTATDASAFDDLTIFEDPSFSLTALNGTGQPFSQVALLGYQPTDNNVLFPSQWVVSSTNTYYDTMGRPNVAGEALNAPLKVIPALAPATGYDLIPQDQTTYLYSPQGTDLDLTSYLSGSDGRTFSEAAFEASPLGRPTNMNAPRGPFTSGDNYCTQQMIYGSSATVGNAPSTGTGLYRVATRQALRQTTETPSQTASVVTILDQTTTDTAGRVLMRQNGLPGSLLQTGYVYNSTGQVAAIYPPNYYAPPTGTVAADWQETFSYNFLGQKITHTTPDAGTKQWAYDRLGRIRFIYTANGVPVSPNTTQTIVYYQYDALNRVVQTGYIKDSRYTWGGTALTDMLEVANFPIITANPTGTNEAAGAINKATVYDTDGQFTNGASFTRFLIGRPVQGSITPSDGTSGVDVETYTYDAHGNLLTKTTVMPGLSPTAGWTTTYTYNAQNQINTVTYPPMETTEANPTPSGSLTKVGYGYDRLGRMAAVGGQATSAVVDPENCPSPLDMSYAGYARDTFGKLTAAQYNNGGSPNGDPLLRTLSYDSNMRLSSIADPYFNQSLTYNNSSTVSGWDYFQSKVSSSMSTYIGGSNATQPLPDFSQNFVYDGYGRLSSASNTLGSAFSLTMGNGSQSVYDANGNILGMSQGASVKTYDYTPPTGSSPSNQVTRITSNATANVDFSQATPLMNGWSYGSSNGGTSTSALTTNTPVTGSAQALKLAGGSLGHYEALILPTFLTPGISYTLTWSAATGSGYPSTPGTTTNGAGWFAVLNGASGPVAVVPLGAVAQSASTWQAGTLTVDLSPAGITALAGTFTEIVWVSLELRNMCVGNAGSAGAAVYLASVGLANSIASDTAATYSYDPSGQVIAAPGRELVSLAYDICTGLTSSIAIGTSAATPSNLAFAYGANNLRSRSTLTPEASTGQQIQRTITLTGANGEVLGTQTTSGSTVTGTTYYINGVDGPFAMIADAQTQYMLTDRLGSLRGVVQGTTGTLLSASDTQTFGAAQRNWGSSGTDIDYTGQRRDSQTGLYNYNARLYDPTLGRFYATDPAGQYASPYSYCGSDPVNFTDPSGKVGVLVGAAAANAVGGTVMTEQAFGYDIFNRFFTSARVDSWAHSTPKLSNLYVGGFIAKTIGQVKKNFSGDEYLAVGKHYPWSQLVVTIDLLYRVYRPIETDVGRNYINDSYGNAARHFFYIGRLVRFGSQEFAKDVSDAHEIGRPGEGHLGFYDNIADKINNLLALNVVGSDTTGELQDIYDRLKDGKLLAQSGQGSSLFQKNANRGEMEKAFEEVTSSFNRTLSYLNKEYGIAPEFNSLQRDFLQKSIGWQPTE
jgi:RHS repeat-associated protein